MFLRRNLLGTNIIKKETVKNYYFSCRFNSNNNNNNNLNNNNNNNNHYDINEIKTIVLSFLPPFIENNNNNHLNSVSPEKLMQLLPIKIQNQIKNENNNNIISFIKENFPNDVIFIEHSENKTISGLLRRNQNHKSIENNNILEKNKTIDYMKNNNNHLNYNFQGRITDAEIMNALIHYIPTFFVPATVIAEKIPIEFQKKYFFTNHKNNNHNNNATALTFLIKSRLRNYIDLKTKFQISSIRLNNNFNHKNRGKADLLYPNYSFSLNNKNQNNNNTISRNSEINLLQLLIPQIIVFTNNYNNKNENHKNENNFILLSTFLSEFSTIITTHNSFNSALGVMGFLEKYNEYFQIIPESYLMYNNVENNENNNNNEIKNENNNNNNFYIRLRPYDVAPFSLGNYNRKNSPEKEIFEKIINYLEKRYEQVKKEAEAELMKYNKNENNNNNTENEIFNFTNYMKKNMPVSTGRLYALLTEHEKINIIKKKYVSFPKFLRLHGKEISVRSNNMQTSKFLPEQENYYETTFSFFSSFSENHQKNNQNLLKIPLELDVDRLFLENNNHNKNNLNNNNNKNNAWALKELYDALPLTQSALLEDILIIIPASVRDSLFLLVSDFFENKNNENNNFENENEKLCQFLNSFPKYFYGWKNPDSELFENNEKNEYNYYFIQRGKLEIPPEISDNNNNNNNNILTEVATAIPFGGIKLKLLYKKLSIPTKHYFSVYGYLKTLKKFEKKYFLMKGDEIIRIQ